MQFVDAKTAARATLIAAISICCCLSAPWSSRCGAVDQITYRRNKEEHSIEGKLLVTAQDGGLMLMTADGCSGPSTRKRSSVTRTTLSRSSR